MYEYVCMYVTYIDTLCVYMCIYSHTSTRIYSAYIGAYNPVLTSMHADKFIHRRLTCIHTHSSTCVCMYACMCDVIYILYFNFIFYDNNKNWQIHLFLLFQGLHQYLRYEYYKLVNL